MKQFFLFLSLGACVNMFATVRTVSNNPGSLAQYSTIQAAVNASSNGDTIYVQGSASRYTGFNITDKRLTVIGTGWLPLQNFLAFKSTVDTVVISGNNSKNTEIQGLDVFMSVTLNTHDSVRFTRNRFANAIYLASQGTYNGLVFQDNWFDKGYVSASAGINITNILFQNNIFYCISTNGNISGLLNSQNVLFDHNLWYGPAGALTAPCISGASRNLLFTNNIFVHRDAAYNNTFSVFNKNITFGAGVNNPWDSIYSNSGAGNIANQDPQMFNQDSVNAGHDNPLLNFTIAAGPANTSGTDGKDMGLMYDPVGILNWSNTRLSRIPYIYSMNISNSSITPGGTLSVQVEARKSN
jgi:hypothetical protein